MVQRNVAVITGAGSGIGLAVAARLWQANWRVIAVGRNLRKLTEAAAKAPSNSAWSVACDVADATQVARLASALAGASAALPFESVAPVDAKGREAECFASWGADVRALVNNAGVYQRASVLESTDESWDVQYQTNLMGSVRMARATLPAMLRAGEGSIVNVASTLGLAPVAHVGAYAASKAAMISFTRTLALECAPRRVRVNCVAPGLVETPIHGDVFGRADEASNALRAQMDAMQPLGRMGRPEEIAEAIFYFCSPLSAWTTGAVLSVDGGIGLA